MSYNADSNLSTSEISIQDINNEVKHLLDQFQPVPHEKLLKELLGQVERIDFRAIVGLADGSDKLSRKHYLVACVEQVLVLAKQNSWGMCQHNGKVYLYNGAFWSSITEEELQNFLGEAAEKMGVDKFDARHFLFREQLLKQFMCTANLTKPVIRDDVVLVNLQNGTFEISPHKQILRAPDPADFLTYQLPFAYDPAAKAPAFLGFLDHVVPDGNLQLILAEFVGAVFLRGKTLKLEKALLLYGTGANGKSVFFEILNALLGPNNVSNHSLQNLTDNSGQYRAMIADKLVNYASELNGRMGTDMFKQLVSGEPVGARHLYKDPIIIDRYAKLIFNCNELPKEVEHTHGFFRRFLIIPFEVTIPEEKQDRELAGKIIAAELPGIFNWALEGLKRLLQQKTFTYSDVVQKQVAQFRQESDSVMMFLDEEYLEPCPEMCRPLKELYQAYRAFCVESGYHACALKTFSARLKAAGYHMERKNFGQAIYLRKKVNY
ncbi:phage/plasmid primase, P4 family [Pontibacter sp. H259]|uniref:DNA primase family protein n=1 Tax=Pontibacter sp. H259 TaxID=3133421 RepID=UPI0030BFE6DD